MPSMSYCLFQNTAADLRRSRDKLEEDVDEMSIDEQNARQILIDLCVEIANNYGEEEEDA